MSTITKEQAQKIIEAADEVITALDGTHDDIHPESDNMLRLWDDLNDRYAPPEVVRELARIALASLEAEPVAYIAECGTIVSDADPFFDDYNNPQPLYRHAQPALAAIKDNQIRELVNELRDIAVEYHGTQQLRERIARTVRAAMLQGAEQPQSSQQNIPENIPGGLLEAVNSLLNHDGSRGCYSAMECGAAREKIELWLAQRQKWEAQRAANLSTGNSPAIPDGWVACSERMPNDGQEVIVQTHSGWRYVSFYDAHSRLFYDGPEGDVEYILVTHWMPLAAAPQQE